MQKCNENAANRYSYVGEVYNVGERKRKEEILNSLPTELSAFDLYHGIPKGKPIGV